MYASAEPLDPADLTIAGLMHLARQRALTIADIAGLDPSLGRVELIDGVLVVTPSPDFAHQDTCVELVSQLNQSVPEGYRAYVAGNVFEPGSDRLLFIPDVLVVNRSKIVRVSGQGEGVFPDAIELAVEVTSVSTRDVGLGAKRDRFERWGVPYLVIDRGG